MARITVEDCLTRENNRFALVQLAAKRTKQLLNGSRVLIGDQRGNKAVVTALREIAAGQVRFMTEQEILDREASRKREIEDARTKREAQAQAMAAAQSVSLASLGAPPASSSDSESSESEIPEGEALATKTNVGASTNGTH